MAKIRVQFFGSKSKAQIDNLSKASGLTAGAIYFTTDSSNPQIIVASANNACLTYSVGNIDSPEAFDESINTLKASLKGIYDDVDTALDALEESIISTRNSIQSTIADINTSKTNISNNAKNITTVWNKNYNQTGPIYAATAEINTISAGKMTISGAVYTNKTGVASLMAKATGIYNTSVFQNVTSAPELANKVATAAYYAGLADTDTHAALTGAYAKEAELKASLENALKFQGLIKDGGFTYSQSSDGKITISKTGYTPSNGDVVIDSNNAKEYVYVKDTSTTGHWEEIGDEASYVLEDDWTDDVVVVRDGYSSSLANAGTTNTYHKSAITALSKVIYSATGVSANLPKTATTVGWHTTMSYNLNTTTTWINDRLEPINNTAVAVSAANHALTSAINANSTAAGINSASLRGTTSTYAGIDATALYNTTVNLTSQPETIIQHQDAISGNKYNITECLYAITQTLITTNYARVRASASYAIGLTVAKDITAALDSYLTWS